MKFFWMAGILLTAFFANAAYIPAKNQQSLINTSNTGATAMQSKMATMSVSDYENLTG